MTKEEYYTKIVNELKTHLAKTWKADKNHSVEYINKSITFLLAKVSELEYELSLLKKNDVKTTGKRNKK